MVNLVDITIIGPDNPGADTLFLGSTKLNDNLELFRAKKPGFAATVPLADFWVFFAEQNLGSATDILFPASVLPGSTIRMYLTSSSASDQITFPKVGLVAVTGQYQTDQLNVVDLQVHSGEDPTNASTFFYSVDIKNLPPVSTTGLAFRQDTRTGAPGLFTSFGHALDANEGSGTPSSEVVFSRLGNFGEQYRQRDGFYYWRLIYYKAGAETARAEWRQTSSFWLTPDHVGSVDNYLAYSVPGGFSQLSFAPNTPFQGLATTGVQTFTFFTGIPGEGPFLPLRSVLGVNDNVLGLATPLSNPFGSPATYDPHTVVPGTVVDDDTVELYALEIQQ